MIVSLTASVVLFTFTVVSLALIPIGIGPFTTPVVLTALRGYTAQRRLLAAKWSDVRILPPYRRMPSDLRGGFVGQVERCALMLKDPATWRDVLWLLVDMTAGCVTALLLAALFAYPFESLVLVAGLWRLFTEGGAYWYGPVAVHSQGTAFVAVAFGLVVFHLAVRYNTTLLRAHFALTKSLLGPTNEMTLAQRVDHLTETRHDAVDSSAAELHRIERDLIGPDPQERSRQWPAPASQSCRPRLLAYAYLLGAPVDEALFLSLERLRLARTVFGPEIVDREVDTVYGLLRGWGYRLHMAGSRSVRTLMLARATCAVSAGICSLERGRSDTKHLVYSSRPSKSARACPRITPLHLGFSRSPTEPFNVIVPASIRLA